MLTTRETNVTRPRCRSDRAAPVCCSGSAAASGYSLSLGMVGATGNEHIGHRSVRAVEHPDSVDVRERATQVTTNNE